MMPKTRSQQWSFVYRKSFVRPDNIVSSRYDYSADGFVVPAGEHQA